MPSGVQRQLAGRQQGFAALRPCQHRRSGSRGRIRADSRFRHPGNRCVPGLFRAHRIEVEQGAANCKITVFHDLCDALIAGCFQLQAQLVEVELLAPLRMSNACAADVGRRRNALEQRLQVDHEDAALPRATRPATAVASKRCPGAARTGRTAASPSRGTRRWAGRPVRRSASPRRAGWRRHSRPPTASGTVSSPAAWARRNAAAEPVQLGPTARRARATGKQEVCFPVIGTVGYGGGGVLFRECRPRTDGECPTAGNKRTKEKGRSSRPFAGAGGLGSCQRTATVWMTCWCSK